MCLCGIYFESKTYFVYDKLSLTVKLEVVVHDEAAGEAEGHVVIILKRHQERVVQKLYVKGLLFNFWCQGRE